MSNGLPPDDLSPAALNGGTPDAGQPPAATPTPDATQAPVAIDWSKVDPKSIPANLIKANPTYAEVLSESIQRRQELKAVKDQIAGTQKPAEQAQTNPNEQGFAKELAEIRAQLAEVTKVASQAGRKALVDQAIEAHNLPSSSAAWITGNTPDEIKAQAAELSKTFLTPNASGSTGAGSVATPQDKIRAAIQARIKGTNGAIDPVEGSMFNPTIQDRIS